jgi:hypothetical protein
MPKHDGSAHREEPERSDDDGQSVLRHGFERDPGFDVSTWTHIADAAAKAIATISKRMSGGE